MGWLDGIMTFLSLIFAFVLILGLAYVTTKVVASASFKKYKNRNMRLLEGMQLGPQKSLQLVKVGNKVLLLALTKDHVVKIETYMPHELNITDDEDTKQLSFQDIFNDMTKGFMNSNANDEINVINENSIDENQNEIKNQNENVKEKSNDKYDTFDIKTILRKTHK